MTTATAERERIKTDSVSVGSFAVEIDHPRNCDILLQSIPGCRLRSMISGTKPAMIRNKAGKEEARIPQDQSIGMGSLPPIPGMQIGVKPDELSYRIYDPLSDDEDLCERIKKAIDDRGVFRCATKLHGAETLVSTLDKHRMKCLCRELRWLLDENQVKVIKGTAPTMAEIDAMPGKYLLNPGSRIPSTQPRFECDWDDWYDKLSRSGG